MDSYTYEADVKWIGERKTSLSAAGSEIEVDSPPEFGGPGGQLTPEVLFPGILASCLLTTFLEFKERMGIRLHSWDSHASSVLGPSPEKGFAFKEISVHIRLRIDPADKEKIPRAMELTKKYCFISRAIRGNVQENVTWEII